MTSCLSALWLVTRIAANPHAAATDGGDAEPIGLAHSAGCGIRLPRGWRFSGVFIGQVNGGHLHFMAFRPGQPGGMGGSEPLFGSWAILKSSGAGKVRLAGIKISIFLSSLSRQTARTVLSLHIGITFNWKSQDRLRFKPKPVLADIRSITGQASNDITF